MERDVMDIIKEKEFIELTPNERAELREMCSTEDEFNQMKNLFVGMEAISWSNPTPRAGTKASLDALFQQKHPKAAPIWYNSTLALIVPREKPFYRQPLIQAAAVGLLFLVAYPFVNSTSMDSKTNQVAQIDEKKVEPKQGASQKSKQAAEPNQQTQSNLQRNETIGLSDEETTTRAISSGSASDATLTAKSPRTFDVIAAAPSPVIGSVPTRPGSTHPDGIFNEDRAQLYSAPASRQPAVFDLLTSTF